MFRGIEDFKAKREMAMELTAIIEWENDVYVALCPQLDMTSQGNTIKTARDNLREA